MKEQIEDFSESELIALIPQDEIAQLSERARDILAQATTIEAVKEIANKAEALRIYALRAHLSKENITFASELRVRSQRRLGEMMQVAPKSKGGVPTHRDRKSTGGKNPPVEKSPVYAELGIDKDEAKTARELAKISERKFEEKLNDFKESGDRLTASHLIIDVKADMKPSIQKQKEIEARNNNKHPISFARRFGYFWRSIHSIIEENFEPEEFLELSNRFARSIKKLQKKKACHF